MGPVRRIIPSIGGLDISPIIVLLLLGFIQRLVNSLVLGGGLFGI
jgi:YggT family protein